MLPCQERGEKKSPEAAYSTTHSRAQLYNISLRGDLFFQTRYSPNIIGKILKIQFLVFTNFYRITKSCHNSRK